MAEKKRIVEKATSRFLARERLPIFMGRDIPHTIVVKELADNTIDVVSEHKMPATEGQIWIAPDRIKVMDNGYGISTEDSGDGKTYLWLAMGEMFTSSNYKGEAESVGNNGVGLTTATMTSLRATALIFPHEDSANKNVVGYSFTDGYLNGSPEAVKAAQDYLELNSKLQENIQQQIESGQADDSVSENSISKLKKRLRNIQINRKFVEQLVKDNEKSGDFVKNPLDQDEALKKYDPYFKDGGFMLDLLWPTVPNDIFEDEIDLKWLQDYIELRIGESHGRFDVRFYKDNDFNEDSLVYKKTIVRDFREKGKRRREPNTVPNWEERVVKESGKNSLRVNKNIRVAFFEDEIKDPKLCSMVQGAKIFSKNYFNYRFDIEDHKVSMSIPYVFYYKSEEYPKYTDQTKVNIVLSYSDRADIKKRFESSPVYQKYYKEAEMQILKHEIANSDSKTLWPALGPVKDSELIIAEGYSPISAVKARRDPQTQACIGLKGKIKSTWRSSIDVAVKSPVVKEILNELMNRDYKQIIISTDADADGSSITTLLLSLIANYTDLIQREKIKLVYTPHYIFRHKNEAIKWSEDPSDCPKGWLISVNKGLGSLNPEDIEMFITNKKTRKLVNVVWTGEEDERALDFAMLDGGRSWIQ